MRSGVGASALSLLVLAPLAAGELQQLMNELSQLGEMSAAVVDASSQAIQSMARNVKG